MKAVRTCVVATLILCGLVVLFARCVALWLQAYFKGARIGFLDLVRMSIRKANPRALVQCKVMAVPSGLVRLSTRAIEARSWADGYAHRVAFASIAAHRAGLHLSRNNAAAIDSARRDVMEAVGILANPKVSNCPDPNSRQGTTLYETKCLAATKPTAVSAGHRGARLPFREGDAHG